MNSAKVTCALAAGLLVAALSQAVAQRVQFATPAANGVPPTTATTPAVTSPPAYGTAPTPTPSPYPTAPPLGGQPAAAPTTAMPGTVAPAAPAPVAPTVPVAPGSTPAPSLPTYTPQPGVAAPAPAGAAVNGTIQAPPPNWDPYATPTGPTGTLMSQDPLIPAGACQQFSVTTMQKFIQQVDLNFDWLAGNPGTGSGGQRELGVDDINLDVTFAFPMLFNSSTPLLVTPGFAVHYWSGPLSLPPTPPDFNAPADMPARTYDAYLDFAWNPWVNQFFGGELNFRTGVFSDFYDVTTNSLRYMGKGMAVLRFSPSMTVKAGVWYLDRVKVKVLPAGGVVWTPNPDVYFDILFPNPKVGKRLTTWGCTEWWLYARGEYGGGVWTIRRNTEFYNGVDFPVLKSDLVDYDDIRIAAGLDFKTRNSMKGYFEVGLACSRQLNYRSELPPSFYPNNTVFLGAGLSY